MWCCFSWPAFKCHCVPWQNDKHLWHVSWLTACFQWAYGMLKLLVQFISLQTQHDINLQSLIENLCFIKMCTLVSTNIMYLYGYWFCLKRCTFVKDQSLVSVVASASVWLVAAVIVSRLFGWIALWSRSSFLCLTSASFLPKSPSCVSTTLQSGMSKVARSMTSSCALRTSSMRWFGRRSCEVLKRLLVAQTQYHVRFSPQLFIF